MSTMYIHAGLSSPKLVLHGHGPGSERKEPNGRGRRSGFSRLFAKMLHLRSGTTRSGAALGRPESWRFPRECEPVSVVCGLASIMLRGDATQQLLIQRERRQALSPTRNREPNPRDLQREREAPLPARRPRERSLRAWRGEACVWPGASRGVPSRPGCSASRSHGPAPSAVSADGPDLPVGCRWLSLRHAPRGRALAPSGTRRLAAWPPPPDLAPSAGSPLPPPREAACAIPPSSLSRREAAGEAEGSAPSCRRLPHDRPGRRQTR